MAVESKQNDVFFCRVTELTPQQFLAEEKALRNDHEQEYSVFTEVPEMHPDYEEKYEQFVTDYRKRDGGNSALEEEVWL